MVQWRFSSETRPSPRVRVSPPHSVTLRRRSSFQAPELSATLGKHALLVTSRKAMHDLGYVDELVAGLRQHGVAFTCYRDCSVGPTTDEVDAGAKLAKEVGADMVIALGGGSALDGGKAIAAVACSDSSAVDLLYGRASVQDALPIVALPTTAGTGSEMNKSAIITDPARKFKDGIRSPRLYPRFAVVDPHLTLSVPYQVTAHTGFDILAHAVESFVSPRAQPIADASGSGGHPQRQQMVAKSAGRLVEPGRTCQSGLRQHDDGN